MNLKFSRQIFEKESLKIKFNQSPFSRSRVFPADGQNGRYDEASSRFSQFCERAGINIQLLRVAFLPNRCIEACYFRPRVFCPKLPHLLLTRTKSPERVSKLTFAFFVSSNRWWREKAGGSSKYEVTQLRHLPEETAKLSDVVWGLCVPTKDARPILIHNSVERKKSFAPKIFLLRIRVHRTGTGCFANEIE